MPLAWRITACIMAPGVAVTLVAGYVLNNYVVTQISRVNQDGDVSIFLLFVVLSLWPLAVVVAICRRMPAARWIGGALIGMFVLAGVEWLRVACVVSGDWTAWIARMAGGVACELLLLYWLYVFACSDKVDCYLGRR